MRLLKIKLFCIIFNNLNPTSRKIKRFSISKTNRVILCRDRIYVYSENRVEHKNVEDWKNVEAMDFEVNCTYSQHLSFEKYCRFFMLSVTIYKNMRAVSLILAGN